MKNVETILQDCLIGIKFPLKLDNIYDKLGQNYHLIRTKFPLNLCKFSAKLGEIT